MRGVNNRTVRDDSVACNFISLDKVYDPAAKTMELSPWKGTVDITCTSGDKTVKVEAHGNEITYVKDGRVFFDLTPDAESANDFTVPRNSVCILTPGLAEPAAPEAPPVQKTIKI